MLRSQGASDSHSYIQQVVHAYPKFTPLLYSRVPQHLIPLICNDPVVKQLASIIANKHVRIYFKFFPSSDKTMYFILYRMKHLQIFQ